jgi:hypothetical protein
VGLFLYFHFIIWVLGPETWLYVRFLDKIIFERSIVLMWKLGCRNFILHHSRKETLHHLEYDSYGFWSNVQICAS